MADRKTREKRRAARLRKNAALKLASDELENLIEENEDEELEQEPEEEITKEFDYPVQPMMEQMPPPATSFEELDALEIAREKAEAVQEVTWQVKDLVHNILYSPEMKPTEKAAAIKAVADEFSSRVETEMSEGVSEKSLDMDLLELEALIAKENRNLPISEKLTDWIEKKKLTARAENALSDEQFALVYEEAGKKVRKYPIHDKAHVRNALARAAQMLNRGGKAAEDARKALPKIRAAAKKMGIGTEKERSAIVVEKDASGKWRAVMWPSNNFKDLDNEIISEQAHKEYVDWVNENMDAAPVFQTWHRPGTRRQSPVDFVSYEHGFLIMSAPLTEKEAAGLLRAQKKTDIGMSHGSFVLERDPLDKRVITKYRMVEVSDLPLEKAANPFTDIETLKEVDMAIDTKGYLTEILGDEKAAEEHLKKMLEKQAVLRENKVEEKEAKPTQELKQETKPEAKPAETLDVEAIVERVAKELGIEQLSVEFGKLKETAEKVPVLEDLVKELAASSDQKLAEMIQPPVAKNYSWLRPSQKEENVLKAGDKKDDELKKAKPEVGWLSEISGTTPIQ